MPRFINPTVLMTRPHESSERFVQALAGVAGPFEHVICPAFEYAGTDAFFPDFDIGIFSSRAGVQFAPSGAGRIAYCVGDATARAAKLAGYVAMSAQGAADDLVRMILADAPEGKLLHIRGETSVGDVRKTLVAHGLRGAEVVAYRKDVMDLSALEKVVKPMDKEIILPLFSAETVSIIRRGNIEFPALNVVALSPAVAAAADQLSTGSITTASAPTQEEMVRSVARMIA